MNCAVRLGNKRKIHAHAHTNTVQLAGKDVRFGGAPSGWLRITTSDTIHLPAVQLAIK
jgi:hypothetical protein